MNLIWNRIDRWLEANTPQVLETLKLGATEEEIDRAEAFFGVAFPEDLKLSYSIHNGQDEGAYSLFPHLEFLSLQSAIEIAENWRKCADEDFRCHPDSIDDGIWNGWWNPHWIPFTRESNGACECVDLSPASNGTPGQVIIVEWREPTRGLVAPSFRVYLETFADALERGDYRFSEDWYGLVDRVELEMLDSK
jgi:cell wall assembly regulator SMI1